VLERRLDRPFDRVLDRRRRSRLALVDERPNEYDERGGNDPARQPHRQVHSPWPLGEARRIVDLAR
jgi:hypothetical protein